MVQVILSDWSLYVYLAALFVAGVGLVAFPRRIRSPKQPVQGWRRRFADAGCDAAFRSSSGLGQSSGAAPSTHITARRPVPAHWTLSGRRPEDIARELAGLLR